MVELAIHDKVVFDENQEILKRKKSKKAKRHASIESCLNDDTLVETEAPPKKKRKKQKEDVKLASDGAKSIVDAVEPEEQEVNQKKAKNSKKRVQVENNSNDELPTKHKKSKRSKGEEEAERISIDELPTKHKKSRNSSKEDETESIWSDKSAVIIKKSMKHKKIENNLGNGLEADDHNKNNEAADIEQTTHGSKRKRDSEDVSSLAANGKTAAGDVSTRSANHTREAGEVGRGLANGGRVQPYVTVRNMTPADNLRPELMAHFAQFGAVTGIRFVTHGKKAFVSARVLMASRAEAEKACEAKLKLNGRVLEKSVSEVEYLQPPKKKRRKLSKGKKVLSGSNAKPIPSVVAKGEEACSFAAAEPEEVLKGTDAATGSQPLVEDGTEEVVDKECVMSIEKRKSKKSKELDCGESEDCVEGTDTKKVDDSFKEQSTNFDSEEVVKVKKTKKKHKKAKTLSDEDTSKQDIEGKVSKKKKKSEKTLED